MAQRNQQNQVKWQRLNKKLAVAAILPAFAYGYFGMKENNTLCESKERYDIDANGIQLEGNLPIEDRLIAKHFDSVKAFYLGVFDGHGGWQVADYCHHKLHVYLEEFLQQGGAKTEK